jgi:subtilisin family serine protease
MKTIILGLMLITSVAHATIKVAVIDSGLNGRSNKLCSTGHYDFIAEKAGVGVDKLGHGTKVVRAIQTYATGDYCLVILKVFPETNKDLVDRAVIYAVSIGATVINMSMQGDVFLLNEYFAMRDATVKGVKIFIAAGNDGLNLDQFCGTYPACYNLKNTVVVGSTGNNKMNHGSIITENENYCFEKLCGTSLSTAIATGKYIRSVNE